VGDTSLGEKTFRPTSLLVTAWTYDQRLGAKSTVPVLVQSIHPRHLETGARVYTSMTLSLIARPLHGNRIPHDGPCCLSFIYPYLKHMKRPTLPTLPQKVTATANPWHALQGPH
jgi:hypothetical protein